MNLCNFQKLFKKLDPSVQRLVAAYIKHNLEGTYDPISRGKALTGDKKGLWRYRWLGQTYLPVMHWFDRGLEGMRGEALKASAWHYRAMVSETIRQFMRMFAADANLGGDPALREKTLAHDETVWGGIFYPWRDRIDDVPLQMTNFMFNVQ